MEVVVEHIKKEGISTGEHQGMHSFAIVTCKILRKLSAWNLHIGYSNTARAALAVRE
jgi:hypothetical protein